MKEKVDSKIEKRLEELTKQREGFIAEHEQAKRSVNIAMQKIIAISGGIQELEGLLCDSVPSSEKL